MKYLKEEILFENVFEVVEALNLAFKQDSEAITKLVERRVKVNDELADHPHFQVTESNGLGLLGVVNGVLSSLGYQQMVIAIFDPSGKLTGFGSSIIVEQE